MKQSKNTTQDLSKIKHSTTISLKIYQTSSIQHKYDSRCITKEEEVKPYHSRSSKNPAVKEIPLKCYHKSSSQKKASRSPKTNTINKFLQIPQQIPADPRNNFQDDPRSNFLQIPNIISRIIPEVISSRSQK